MAEMDRKDASEGRLSPLRERSLIESARGGCGESARSLVIAHQDRLHAFVWRMVRNNDDAAEICQEAFLRAFQSLDEFNFAYRFSTWLFTIAYRLCLNNLRRRKDYSGDVDVEAMAPLPRRQQGDPVGEEVANSDEARRMKRIIWEAVDQLSPPQRATVLLFYRESLTCQEVGEILGMPSATVKSHLHRARNRLKDVLSDEFAEGWSSLRLAEGGAA